MNEYLNFGYETQEEWDALSDEEKRDEAYEYYLDRSLYDLGDNGLLEGWFQDIHDAMSSNDVPEEIKQKVFETINSGHGIGKGSFTRKQF